MTHFCGKNALKYFLCGLLAALIAAVVVLSCVPPVSRDALTHHLAIPKLYLKHGGMYEIPNLIFSYYPMNLDLLYIVPLSRGNDILPKFIHFAFGLLTAGLIYRYLVRRTDRLCALAGVLLFLSVPVIMKLSITVYVDLGLVFFSTAALINFLKWIENAFKPKYLIIAAVWCGLALGTKYNGLILLCLLPLFVAFGYSLLTRTETDKAQVDRPSSGDTLKTTFTAIGYATVFVLIAVLIYSPWAIRNFVWTSNPIYPLYDSWFRHVAKEPDGHSLEDVGDHKAATYARSRGLGNPFVIRKLIYQENGWQIAAVPVRIFFQGQDNNPQYFDGRLNPYLFFLPIFAFIFSGREKPVVRREQQFFIAFAVLFLLFAFFQRDLRIRYIAPMIPPLVILSVFGLKGLLDAVRIKWTGNISRIAAVVVVAGVVLLGSGNVMYTWHLFQRIDPFSYLSGRVAREAYIEKYRPEFAALQFANKNLADNAKIFCLFLGNRSYYSDREMLFGDFEFEGMVKKAGSAESIVAELDKSSITHVLVKYDILNSWAGIRFNAAEKKTITALFKTHADLVFKSSGYGLYQLASLNS
jgi:hypothetical protein